MGIKLVHRRVETANNSLEGRTIYDNEGYAYNVGPNEHINSLDDGRFAPAAGLADSPNVILDIIPTGQAVS